MRTNRRILIAAIVVVLVGGFSWFALSSREREPEYQGEKLSYWLRQYTHTITQHSEDSQEHESAKQAVRAIGTNAIPALLRMLQEQDSRITVKIDELLSQQQLIRNPIVSAMVKQGWALSGFEILGGEAKGAVPTLIEILKKNESHEDAALALGRIGPAAKEAVPTLLNTVTNTNRPRNIPAIYALGQIHAEPGTVVPVLVTCMTNFDRDVSLNGIQAIGSFGPDAQQAIPTLMAEATNSTFFWRFEAMKVLGRIHSQPDLVIPFLSGLLTDPNPNVRNVAVEGLVFFGREAKPVLAEVVELSGDKYESVRASALEAAAKIDVQNEGVLYALAQAMTGTNGYTRQTAVKLFWNAATNSVFKPGISGRTAVPVFINALHDQDRTARLIAEAGLKTLDPEAAAKAGVK